MTTFTVTTYLDNTMRLRQTALREPIHIPSNGDIIVFV